MRRFRDAAPLAVAVCAAVAALVGVPSIASAAPPLQQTEPVAPTQAGPTTQNWPVAPTQADLTRLQGQLDQATAQAEQLAGDLEQSAARASALRTSIGRLAEQQDAARAAVDARARQAYVAAAPAGDPIAGLVRTLAAPDLQTLADAELARRAAAGSVRAAQQLLQAVTTSSAAAQQLREQTAIYRAQLQAQIQAALTAQEQGRQLLAQAQAAVAAEQARRQEAAQAAAMTALQAQLAAVRGRLDAASASVTVVLTPAQTARTRAAAKNEGPVLALVEAAGSGYPAGYRPTGVVLTGQASWYGPGFVGNPTASGAPYDPERLTCAHKTLPLGTVVRVTSGSRSVSCLVDDRGPYVAGRIIDMSRAGARALGFDGVASVSVEVLAPPG